MTTLRQFLVVGLFTVSSSISAASICGDFIVEPGETCDPPRAPTCDCCQIHATPGCSDPACESQVCAVDVFCCEAKWDRACVEEALTRPDCISCCIDCRPNCTYCGDGLVNDPTEACDPLQPQAGCNCCRATWFPGCSDDACEDAVCASDPFCCAVMWDPICGIEATDKLACIACCPRDQCTLACAPDQDEDGIEDAADPCPQGPNPEGADAIFGQLVFALDTGDRFGWAYPVSFVSVKGEFSSAFEIGGYVETETSSGSGTQSLDLESPGAGTGLWYLWKPDCEVASWSSGDTVEIACTAASDCCVPHATPGCSEPSCASTVCRARPSCCEESWDSLCVTEANTYPACVNGCDGTLCRDAGLP